MSEVTTTLLGTVVSLFFALAGYFLIPVLKRWLDAKVGTEKSNLILTWAAALVKAVEQTRGPGMGGTKYALVMDALRGISSSHNITVDDKTLEAAVEAAVFELQQGQGAKTGPSAVGNVVVTAPVAEVKKGEI